MPPAPDTELYDRDFYEWVRHNVDLLRRGCARQADLAHIAEELEGLGNWYQRAIAHRIEKLVIYLLQWKYQPEKRYARSGVSMRLSRILRQRFRIKLILNQSPSLRPYAAVALARSSSG